MFEYAVTVLRVVDGDTVEADIDLGFHIWVRRQKIRLARIDAPETHGETKAAGQSARDWLIERLAHSGTVTVRTTKPDKYGRCLGDVIADGVNLSDAMIALGIAKPYDGGART